MKLLLPILEINLIVVLCTNIHVSNKGNDVLSCGQELHPCKTISYAINKQNKSVTIILHGGTTKQMVYPINQPLYLHKPLSIRKNNRSIFKPKIFKYDHFVDFVLLPSKIAPKKDFVMFHVPPANGTYLSLHGIKFCNIRFYSEKFIILNIYAGKNNTSVDIDINNCIFEEVDTVFMVRKKTNATINITVRNSSFHDVKRFLVGDRESKPANVVLDHSTFTEKTTSYIMGNFDITFTNSTINRLAMKNVFSLNLRQCQFHKIKVETTFNTNVRVEKSSVKSFGYLELVNCTTFIANSLFNSPIMIYHGHVDVNNCTFYGSRKNTFKSNSGTLRLFSSTGRITSSNFSKNAVKSRGGALYIEKSDIIINNSIFHNNSAFSSGGAIFIRKSTVNISNSDISYNKAKEDGGGIYIDERGKLWLLNTNFTFNQAGRAGAAMKTHLSQLYIYSSIIKNNIGDSFGGTFCESSNVTIKNVKFYKNFSPQSPSALFYNVNYKRERLFLKMSNITIQTVAKRKQPVPDAVWITSLRAKHLQVNVNNVNVTLSGTKNRVPSIYLTLPERTNVSLRYTCLANYDASYSNYNHLKGYMYTLSCKFCSRGTYRLQTSSEKIQIPPFNESNSSNKPIRCHVCPVGGNCESHIKSKDRFWGYLIQGHPKFIPCPEQYCCSKKDGKCTSTHSCATHRTGKLCGTCKAGYQTNYFDNRCLSTVECTKHAEFWTVFIIFGITYAIILAYLTEISFFSKYFCLQLLRKSSELRNASKQVEEMRLNELNNTGDSSNIRHEYTLINEDDFVVIHGSPPTEEVTSSNHNYYKQSSRISGILKVLVAFYQIKGLIHIEVDLRTNKQSNVLNTLALEIFNLNIPKNFFTFCPKKEMTVVERMIIKELLFVCCMLLSALIFLLIAALFFVMRRNKIYYWRYRRFLLRASICCLHVIILGYTIWAKFSLQFMNCRNVSGEYILYLNGEITCYTMWQKINIAFFVLWILPFPLTLSISVRLLENHKITAIQFFCCVLFPPFTFAYFILEKFHQRRYVPSDSVLRVYVSIMFQEPFRQYKNGEKCLFWDTWRLYERLVIAVFSTFFIDPIKRLCFILPVMLLLLVVHLRVKPYKSKFIDWMETTSLVSLCFLVGVNEFRAFLYMYSYDNQENITYTATILNIMEFLSTPVIGFMLFMVWKFCRKICNIRFA